MVIFWLHTCFSILLAPGASRLVHRQGSATGSFASSADTEALTVWKLPPALLRTATPSCARASACPRLTARASQDAPQPSIQPPRPTAGTPSRTTRSGSARDTAWSNARRSRGLQILGFVAAPGRMAVLETQPTSSLLSNHDAPRTLLNRPSEQS
ncbi:uncharacterized protein BKA78DRAFT_126306 [Phyllosticta capitalensis]|uniref:uncharacterized protein n=1 Tax=Phyllosticta capitalensis TaxID=121624 RepID=UPI00312D49DC